MKSYDGILILEPEDTYNSPSTPSGICIRGGRGGTQLLYKSYMVIVKTHKGELICIKSRERIPNSYSQAELQEIVDRYENPVDKRIILLNC